MSKLRSKPPGELPPLEGSVESMTEVRDGIELAIKMHNPQNRALYYIADVRAIIFDPVTRRLLVQLSDQGRELPPGGIAMEPRIRSIDPNSEAVLMVRLPKTIVKLASTPSPAGDTVFEEHAVADADQIELEIGWADTPYYRDPRDESRGASPISSWEKRPLRVTYTPHHKRNGQSGG